MRVVPLSILLALAFWVAACSGAEEGADESAVAAVPPRAQLSATPSTGAAPLTVQFVDESSGAISLLGWDFDGDGAVDSTEPSPSHTYEAPGEYVTRLTVRGPAGSDSAEQVIVVTVSGPVSISITPSFLLMSVGQTKQLMARAVLSDDSVQPIGEPGVWSSTKPGVASVSPGGIVVAKAQGTTRVTLRFLDLTDSAPSFLDLTDSR